MVTLNPYRRPCPYDVGDTLITESTLHPAKRWPGTTWRKEEGVFLLGASDKYPLGATGGLAEVTLTLDQIPAHSHPIKDTATTAVGGPASDVIDASVIRWTDKYRGGATGTYDSGGGQAHTNMPPYKAKYIWTRTA